ncbi:MAG: HEAT repeat domain-containing protein [Acidobacteriota bacterium]
MTTIGTKLAAVALTLGIALPAYAGKGGSNAAILQAVHSGSSGAIIAEVERTEGLACTECLQTVTNLLEDNRYEVREVAAWWFAKRVALKEVMAQQFVTELASGDSIAVRNAADFLGATVYLKSLPALRSAITRSGLTSEAKLALVHAVKYMAHVGGNPVLVTAMTDADPAVRAAAVTAWRDILGQTTAVPVEPSLRDGDASVRAAAAAVMGAMHDTNAVSTLEQLVTSDADPFVRRNAAWALGKLGSASSREALTIASTDKSGIVRGVAKASLATLK